jgi:hypothetical protein
MEYIKTRKAGYSERAGTCLLAVIGSMDAMQRTMDGALTRGHRSVMKANAYMLVVPTAAAAAAVLQAAGGASINC